VVAGGAAKALVPIDIKASARILKERMGSPF
jgi:hypothetical protein